MPARRLLLLLGALCACRESGVAQDVDAAGGDAQNLFPAARTDLVGRIGSDQRLDIATWNLENFPLAGSTPRIVADLVASMDLDLVAIQEIEDTAAWDELDARLPGYQSLLSSHTYGNGTYQKIGFLYKASALQLSGGALLFSSFGYQFPRPAFKVVVTAPDLEFVLIALHLKAGFSSEDRSRRQAAVGILEDHMRTIVDGGSEDEIMVLGDFNERITTPEGEAVFAPLADLSRYRVQTEELAEQGGYSFVPNQAMLDHVVTTPSLDDELDGSPVLIAPLDSELAGYVSTVSDHLPVVVSLSLP